MKKRDRFIDRYKEGNTPWVHEEPDFNLIEVVDNWPIHPCKTLELGCGTGTEAIWLSQNGFDVTAIDGSDIAIDIARKDAKTKKAVCNFQVCDFIDDQVDGDNYDFIFDRGFFHSFDSDEERNTVAKKAARQMSERGIWLTLMGSADAPPRDSGPPMRTAKNIIDAVEPYFKILSLYVSFFGNNEENPAKIWVCLLRKR